MASEGIGVGKAYVQILPSTQGIGSNISKALNGEADGAGKSFGGKLGGVIKKAVAAAGIGVTLGKSLTEGAALEQSLGGIETLFKEHADTVIANADKAWKTAGISANSYMEQSTSFAAALLNSLGGDTEKAAAAADQAILDMSDNANKMGTSIEMIQNAYMGFSRGQYMMLDNLKLGYGGTKQEMERLLVDAEKLSGVKYDINNLADVYNAIHVIQDNLDITGTTAKEAATTFSGSMNAMKAAATNMLGDLMLGRNIEPAMQALVESTSTFLFKNLIPAVGRIFVALPKAMGAFLLEGLPNLLASGVIMINQLASSFQGAGKVISNALAGLGDLSDILLRWSGYFVDAGIRLLQNLAQGIADGLPALVQNLPVIVSNIADIINTNAPKLLTAGITIIKTLALGIIKAVPVLIQNLPQIFSAMLKAWAAFNWLSFGKMAINGIKNGVTSAASGVINSIKALIAKIKSMFPFKLGKIFSEIKLPKISLSGGSAPFGIGGKGSLPKFNVKWAAKGGIVDGATLVGAGEKGAEAITPLTPFWDRMDSTLEAMRAAQGAGGGTLTLIMNVDGETIGRSTVDYINGQVLRFGTNPIMI